MTIIFIVRKFNLNNTGLHGEIYHENKEKKAGRSFGGSRGY